MIKLLTIRMLKNKTLWSWGIVFMIFWLFMGAFVFGFKSNNYSVSLYNAAVWYGIIGLISTSSLATSIGFSVYYSNSALAYSFRYTLLKPSRYIMDFVISICFIGLIFNIIILLMAMLMFGIKSGYHLIPALPVYAILTGIASAVFMLLLSIVLIVVINNYIGLKNISFGAYIPLMATYLLAFPQLFISLPEKLVYISPFNDIADIMVYSFYGKGIHFMLGNFTGSVINLEYSVSSLAVWIIILFILSLYIISRIKPRSIEGARQI